MIECFKIKEFVICEIFYPYMSDLLPMDSRFLSYWEEDRIEKRLWKEPEYIIELLEEYPETKRKVFERINKCGGVEFYRYLDMNCAIIQYVQSELPKYYVITADMVRQLREMTGAGMMDCKRAIEKNNNDINKAAEYLRENEWKHRVMI